MAYDNPITTSSVRVTTETHRVPEKTVQATLKPESLKMLSVESGGGQQSKLPSETRARIVTEFEADNLTMDISVDNENDEPLIQLRSKQTGEVVATIPAEHSRNIQNTIRAALGAILDQNA